MIMSIPPTWHKRDLNANMHDNNMIIPSKYNKGISKQNMTNHDNKYITHMIPHHIKQESWKRVRNKIPHQASNRDMWSTIHSKRNTWTHCIYLTSRGHLKKRMSKCWIWSYHQPYCIESHGNGCSHMNANTCTQLRKVAKKWNEKMENINTPLDLWRWIVKNRLSNFWILRKWKFWAQGIF